MQQGFVHPPEVKEASYGELFPRLRFETLLADISATFVNVPADKMDHEIEVAQKRICQSLELDHSSLWQVSPEHPGKLTLTHYYRHQEKELPTPPRNMDGAEFFPWALAKLTKNELVCVPDTSKAPPEATRDAASWLQFGVKATLGIPLSTGGDVPFGVLSFDSTRQTREFPDALVGRLQLIAQVFANALQRKFSQQRLRESEARLSLAASSANAGLWSLDADTGEIWATETALGLFGLAPGEQVNLARLLQVVHPLDRDAVQHAIAGAMSTGDKVTVEYRVLRAGGSEHWLVSHGRRHSHAGEKPHMLMGVTIDVTERKRTDQARMELAGKLLNAQEAEAARIARELHDDLGQRTALFNMQLQRASALIEPKSPAVETAFQQLGKQISELAHRIGSLSHQLHSSELDYLGLATASKALCRVAEQHAVQVSCSTSTPEPLGKNIELCLYRVLQEAQQRRAAWAGKEHPCKSSPGQRRRSPWRIGRRTRLRFKRGKAGAGPWIDQHAGTNPPYWRRMYNPVEARPGHSH
jgi:PAS domain S-box-containing protein